ncbi:MAG: restriction endonuclease subunit S [Desulfobulbaceae bacterium]|nr:restriction endonuclease subunit S [Desulfobulbaceae bacterium]
MKVSEKPAAYKTNLDIGKNIGDVTIQTEWPELPISHVADVNPRVNKSSISDDLPVSFVPMPAVGAGNGSIHVEETRLAGEVKKGYTTFQEGDVLFAKITPCMENGKMAVVPKLVNGCGFGSTEFHVLRPKAGIDAKYLYYYVSSRSFRAEAERHMAGAVGQRRVSTTYLREVTIPVAPLEQQKRIVAEIEKQFSRLDEAVANLKRVKANLKRYKAAVLKAAVEGKLTEKWRENHPDVEPASKLLERILTERRKKWEEAELAKMKAKGKVPKDDTWKKKYKEPAKPNNYEKIILPEKWVSSSIGQISECLDSMRIPVSKKERLKRQGEIPYFGANGQVGWIDDFIFDEPLVLVVEDETFIGRTVPFSYKIEGKTWVNNHAHVLRPSKAVDIDFLNYSLMFYPFIPLTTGTTGRKKLTQRALNTAPYNLPPIEEQKQIVSEIEQRISIVEGLLIETDRNLLRADSLRQSILAKHFLEV